MKRVAVIGTGNWGGKILRSFHRTGALWGFAECDPKRRAKHAELHPELEAVEDIGDVIKAGAAEAVAIATPAPMHYEHCRRALEAGLHAFVEKPLTLDVAQAEELVKLAGEKDLTLMVGHLLLYHPAVKRLKDLVDKGELGKLHYLYGQRVNLGKVRSNENALWSLAPHDISIALHLFEKLPLKVSAVGSCYLQKDLGVEDVVFITLSFDEGELANFQASWLDPHKIRRTTVIGSRKMAVFDDMAPENKLMLYDKHAHGPHTLGEEGAGHAALAECNGEASPVDIEAGQPLLLEAEHFLDCIEKGKKPLSDGENGLAVLRILDAASRSMKNGGIPVSIDH